MNSRALALNLLNDGQKSRQLADELLESALASSPLVGPDRAFVTELFYGCLRRKLSLELSTTISRRDSAATRSMMRTVDSGTR